MTKTPARDLQTKWKQEGDPPPLCAHATLNLERGDVGSFTGDFYCVDGDVSVTNQHRHLVLD